MTTLTHSLEAVLTKPSENRTQVAIVLGFIVIPVASLIALFLVII